MNLHVKLLSFALFATTITFAPLNAAAFIDTDDQEAEAHAAEDKDLVYEIKDLHAEINALNWKIAALDDALKKMEEKLSDEMYTRATINYFCKKYVLTKLLMPIRKHLAAEAFTAKCGDALSKLENLSFHKEKSRAKTLRKETAAASFKAKQKQAFLKDASAHRYRNFTQSFKQQRYQARLKKELQQYPVLENEYDEVIFSKRTDNTATVPVDSHSDIDIDTESDIEPLYTRTISALDREVEELYAAFNLTDDEED